MLSKDVRYFGRIISRFVLLQSIFVLLFAGNVSASTSLLVDHQTISYKQVFDYENITTAPRPNYVFSTSSIIFEETKYIEVFETNEDVSTDAIDTLDYHGFTVVEKSLFPIGEPKRPTKKSIILLYILHHSWKSELVSNFM